MLPYFDVIGCFLRATYDRVRLPELQNQFPNDFELFEEKKKASLIWWRKVKVSLQQAVKAHRVASRPLFTPQQDS
jgi:hypothetical protein